MAHHKRKRPKKARAGCLMCKYWKDNAFKHTSHAHVIGPKERRARVSEKEQRAEVFGR